MPWTHCDQDILDSQACPVCGLEKTEWTLEIEMTREFRVKSTSRQRKKKDAWIAVQLLDGAGDPLAEADYKISLPGSRVKKGTLDAEGRVRIEKIGAGTCLVSFPGHLDEGQERETGEEHVFTLASAGVYLFSM